MSDLLGIGTMLGNIGSQFINNAGSARQNRKNREWQEEMWNKNNAYNTPAMQMARFKEAGLNPHLIYGQGNSGNSGAPPTLPPQRPEGQYNFADAIQTYVANRKQQTEIDNLKKAQDVMDADIIQKGAQSANLLSSSAKTDQDRYQASELFDTVKAQAQANLNNTGIQGRKLEADIQNTLQNTKLTAKQQEVLTQNILESRARILNLKADNNLKGQEYELKRIEIGLRRAGINPNDPAWARLFGRILDETGVTENIIKGAKSVKEFKNTSGGYMPDLNLKQLRQLFKK
jgi:hypothetical protein